MIGKWIALVCVVVLCAASSGWAAEWYVSVGGKADGDGSVKRPWDLGFNGDGETVAPRQVKAARTLRTPNCLCRSLCPWLIFVSEPWPLTKLAPFFVTFVASAVAVGFKVITDN